MVAKNVMLDIETMSTRNDALVLSIGAIQFKLFEDRPVFGEKILLVPNIVDQIIYGRHVDQRTQEFWSKLPDEVSEHWRTAQPTATSIWTALAQLSVFLAPTDFVWAHGITFDIGILESLYVGRGLRVPWKYNAVRDARTIDKCCTPHRTPTDQQLDEIDKLNAHHPVDDCIRQVWSLWQKWPDKLDPYESEHV